MTTDENSIYIINGRRHRANGPASYNDNYFFWWFFGEIHRYYGPAMGDSGFDWTRWCIHDKVIK